MPEVSKVDVHCVGVPTNQNPKNDQRYQTACFGNGENILDQLAKLQTARVHERQQRDHDDPHKLRG